MQRYLPWLGLIGLVLQAGCTSDPTAPVNQVWPVPQLDSAFGDPHPRYSSRSDVPDYKQRPGYLPAYPPYQGYQPYPPGMRAAPDGDGSAP